MSNVVPFNRDVESVQKEAQTLVMRTKADAWAKNAMQLQVVDDESMAVAIEQGRAGVTLEKGTKEYFDPIIEDWHAGHSKWCKERKSVLDLISPAVAYLRKQVATYKDQKDREAAERQRLAEAEAKKLQAATEAAMLDQAQALQDAGQGELAEALLSMPANIVLLVTAEPAVKMDGASSSQKYKAQIVDFPALLRALADGKLTQIFDAKDIEKIQAAMLSKLNKFAALQKELFNVPGVKAVPDTTVSFKKL